MNATLIALIILALLLAPWLVATPAGPALVAVALVAQAQQREPAYAVALVESDREFLSSLLARGI